MAKITIDMDMEGAKARRVLNEVIDLTKKIEDGGKRTAKTTADWRVAMSGVGRELVGMLAGYASISAVIGGIRAAHSAWKQDVREVAETSKSISDSYRTLGVMQGAGWPQFKAAWGGVARNLPGTTEEKMVTAETAVSLMPATFGYSQQQQLAAAREAQLFGAAYKMPGPTAMEMMGKATGMMGKYNLGPSQWFNMLGGMIERGGFAGERLGQWAGAMPKLFGGAIAAGLAPEESIAYAQVLSQTMESPEGAMSAGEQILRKVMLPKAERAIPGLRGLAPTARLDLLSGMMGRGELPMPLMASAFGERGVAQVPKLLSGWHMYGAALAGSRADLAYQGSMAADKLALLGQLDEPARLALQRQAWQERERMAQVEDMPAQRFATWSAAQAALERESGVGPVGRKWGAWKRGIAGFIAEELPGELGYFAWNFVPGSGENSKEYLREIRNVMRNGQHNYAPADVEH